VTGAGKILVVGGAALAAFGMLYGLHYALFVEHQTLDRMGTTLAQSFVSVANRSLQQAQSAVNQYGAVKYDYVRQVDAHSHWGGLAMLMIVLGILFDRVSFSERTRRWLAIMLLTGSVLFPLAVLLQTAHSGGLFASALAVIGSGLVILALAAVAVGYARSS
jgi:hypothetical protein